MDGCVLLTSTPSCVVSPRGETTHSGVDVNNTHPSMINPLIDIWIGSCNDMQPYIEMIQFNHTNCAAGAETRIIQDN